MSVNSEYLAGLIDGEGYVGIVKKKTKNEHTPYWYQAVVSVRMSNKYVVNWMADTYGGSFSKWGQEKDDRQPMYTCEWRGKHAGRVLSEVLPALKVKMPPAYAVQEYLALQEEGWRHRTKVVGERPITNKAGWLGTRPVVAFSDEYQKKCETLYEECRKFNAVGAQASRQARYVVPKGWGYELWIVNTEYCGKKLYFAPGKRLSWHYHNVKDETFYVLRGRLNLYFSTGDDISAAEQTVLNPGDVFHVPVGLRHRLHALEASEVFEFSTHHEDSDSIRIEKGD